MESHDTLIHGLPDPTAAARFLSEFGEKHPADRNRLITRPGLLSDVVTIASFSPLLATTMVRHPEYLWWLDRRRKLTGARSTDDLLESLGRFSLVNSTLDPQAVFARFRRRELLRIYLRDIRRLVGIAEITEEISNVADAVLEFALRLARAEMDKRFGQPQQHEPDGRVAAATFCITALGKLGSRELNYSSDIDLLFIYSAEGETAGGDRGSVTNREYFVKIVEQIVKLVGERLGEGSAYRVDVRLRPHGRLGALAMSVDDVVRYYESEARAWERQVMIRSRASAGDAALFRKLFSRIEERIFAKDESVESALESVRSSKAQIDRKSANGGGYDVKLGRGGIREIEFIAQALQLAHGGRDRWLRSPHTLISLARLAEHGHLREVELARLSAAYEFLRRTEHIIQMENGLQTHAVPNDPERRELLARRMKFAVGGDFERDLIMHTSNVSATFLRVFGSDSIESGAGHGSKQSVSRSLPQSTDRKYLSPRLRALFDVHPTEALDPPGAWPDFRTELLKSVVADGVASSSGEFRRKLGVLRRTWQRMIVRIAAADLAGRISISESKRLQTELAEASIEAALHVVDSELKRRYGVGLDRSSLGVLALGKLGGRGVDHDSDLDLLFVYRDDAAAPDEFTTAEFHARAVELLVTALSSVTREGSLYRVDLRLRPYGTKGQTAYPKHQFLEYMRETAEIWELLAFVKLRAVGGDIEFATEIENETRRIIHERALKLDPHQLAAETRRIRLALEKQRSRTRRTGEIDIKYGEGGMLDVYFAMRYLQLRNNVPDAPDDRSTLFTLELLRMAGSLDDDSHEALACGYEFLSTLDHYLRLVVGRTTRLPESKAEAMAAVAKRYAEKSLSELTEHLTLHRISIRRAFKNIVVFAENLKPWT
jgi:[glutamine synthetase] adenylyltransferase / [glutamine synthetase]-adenylyl-L-tyrosine phosphorylase